MRFQTVNFIDQPPGDIDHFHGLPLLRFDRNSVLCWSWMHFSLYSPLYNPPWYIIELGPIRTRLAIMIKIYGTVEPWPEKSLDQIPNFKPRKPFLKCQANDPPNIYYVC